MQLSKVNQRNISAIIVLTIVRLIHSMAEERIVFQQYLRRNVVNNCRFDFICHNFMELYLHVSSKCSIYKNIILIIFWYSVCPSCSLCTA